MFRVGADDTEGMCFLFVGWPLTRGLVVCPGVHRACFALMVASWAAEAPCVVFDATSIVD